MEKKDTFLEKYTLAAIAHRTATLEGNHRIVNKQYKKLKKLFNILEKDQLLREEVLEVLLQHQNVFVSTWAAAHALGLEERIDDALSILHHASKDPNIGVIRLGAEMTLKQWDEQGKLNF